MQEEELKGDETENIKSGVAEGVVLREDASRFK